MILFAGALISQLGAPPWKRQDQDSGGDFQMTGWATVGEGTTGGTGGEIVTVSTTEAFVNAIKRPEPLIIQIRGTLDLSEQFPGCKDNCRYYTTSNKTLIGLGDDAGFRNGELRLSNVTNVIIRNLSFSNAPGTALAITHGTTHVWVDHNDFSSAGDGLIDITRAADFITVSWNRFSNHDKVSLVGASDDDVTDRGHLRVTYHHNWFIGTNQRHPRVRYGKVHVFNNLYDNIDAGIGIGVEARIVSKANVFNNPETPYHFQDTPEQPGRMKDFGSIFDGDENLPPLRFSGEFWAPKNHYAFTVDQTESVPEIVRSGAGVGVIELGRTPTRSANLDRREDEPSG